MLHLEYCTIWLRDLDTKKTGAEVLKGLQNVMLEKNVQDKIVREGTNEDSLMYRRLQDNSKQCTI